MRNQTATLSTVIKRRAYRENLKYGACRVSKESRQLAILAVLKWYAKAHGKDYSFPSQETILARMEQVHRITMSRRTLNRDLDELRDAGALHSIRRHRRHPKIGFQLRSTAYYILPRLKAWTAAIRKRLEILGQTRVPNSAQYPPSLRKENPHPPETARTGGQIRGRFAPPGALPDFIPA